MFTKEQMTACLKRIGYTGEVALTKECLDDLIFSCQCNVPYDNLDVFDYGREVLLDAESLFNKIVVNGRGGYCFELNGFFFRILKGLGFDVQPCFCRIMFGPVTGPQDNFIDHRASIVTLDGQRYFCDVGTGAPMPLKALPIIENEWYDTRGQQFCVRKSSERNWYELHRKVGEKEDGSFEETLDLYFLDASVQEIDFMTPNFFMYKMATSLPHMRRMVSRKTPTGYVDITNDVFTEVKDGVKTERKLAYEEILPIIQEVIGINVTEPLRKL